MNGKKARAVRRAAQHDDTGRLLMEAHNHLHADPPDVDACHNTLHRAMGTGDVDINPDRWRGTETLDRDFAAFCQRHGVTAMYVVHTPDGRLMSGGDARLCADMDRINRAGIAVLNGRAR